MSLRRFCVLLVIALVSACGDGTDRAELVRDVEPIVVFASYDDRDYLPGFFAAFTEQTGYRVTVRYASPAEHVAAMIDGQMEHPADVYIAPRVADAWYVAENNGLRPLDRGSIENLVPNALRDEDGYWAAWSVRVPLIVFDRDRTGMTTITEWTTLGDASLAGKLCLSSSATSINRTLIANLISSLGTRDAELLVRSWIGNLALPPFETERELLSALARSACSVGIASSQSVNLAALDPAFQLMVGVPEDMYPDVEAVGVGRHARQPDLASRLVVWMLSEDQQARHSDATHAAMPLASDGVASAATAGWFDGEAARLAERARYR